MAGTKTKESGGAKARYSRSNPMPFQEKLAREYEAISALDQKRAAHFDNAAQLLRSSIGDTGTGGSGGSGTRS